MAEPGLNPSVKYCISLVPIPTSLSTHTSVYQNSKHPNWLHACSGSCLFSYSYADGNFSSCEIPVTFRNLNSMITVRALLYNERAEPIKTEASVDLPIKSK